MNKIAIMIKNGVVEIVSDKLVNTTVKVFDYDIGDTPENKLATDHEGRPVIVSVGTRVDAGYVKKLFKNTEK